MSRHFTSCHVMSRHVTSCHVMYLMSRHATPCHVMSHHVMSRHVTSCPVTSHHAMSHHVTSYHFESRGTVTQPTLHCQLTSSTRNQFKSSMTVFVGCPEGCRYHTASAVYDLVLYLYYVPDMTPCIPLPADLLGSLIERIVWIEESFHPDNFHVDPNQPLINN